MSKPRKLSVVSRIGVAYLSVALCLLPTFAGAAPLTLTPGAVAASLEFSSIRQSSEIVAENSFRAVTITGKYAVGHESQEGGLIELQSPWGESLTVRYWHESNGLVISLGDVTLLYEHPDIYARANERLHWLRPDGSRQEFSVGESTRALQRSLRSASDGERELAVALAHEFGKQSLEFWEGLQVFGNQTRLAGCAQDTFLCGATILAAIGVGYLAGQACLIGGAVVLTGPCIANFLVWASALGFEAAACYNMFASCLGQTPQETPSVPGTPILLDLDRDNFHLEGISNGIFFDFNGDGQIQLWGWTRADQRDAFLVFDRNGNGRVDDGTELFGNAVPLLDGSTSAHGYEALAEFDQPQFGGNGDGLITSEDAMYSELRVWIDSNHNGFSDEVLTSLSDEGIIALDLDFSERKRTDQHGNVFRYVSTGTMLKNGQVKVFKTADVFFAAGPN